MGESMWGELGEWFLIELGFFLELKKNNDYWVRRSYESWAYGSYSVPKEYLS